MGNTGIVDSCWGVDPGSEDARPVEPCRQEPSRPPLGALLSKDTGTRSGRSLCILNEFQAHLWFGDFCPLSKNLQV